jgi:hypothetical protein
MTIAYHLVCAILASEYRLWVEIERYRLQVLALRRLQDYSRSGDSI